LRALLTLRAYVFAHFSPSVLVSSVQVEYVPERSAIVWRIKQFQGQKEFLMRAHFGLPSVASEEHLGQSVNAKAPIQVQFEIPYFTVSGIQVRYLKIIEKSGYQALPWVRYVQKGTNTPLAAAMCKGYSASCTRGGLTPFVPSRSLPL